MVQLPPRTDETHHLNFTAAEREKYDAVRTQSRELIEQAISSGDQVRKSINELQVINNLRLTCNHGLLTQYTPQKIEQQAFKRLPGSCSPSDILDLLYNNITSSAATCLECGTNLLEDVLEGPMAIRNKIQPQATSPNHRVCEQCSAEASYDKSALSPWDGFNTPDSAENSAPATPVGELDVAFTIECMSTKIKALVADLYKHNTKEKRFLHYTHTICSYFN